VHGYDGCSTRSLSLNPQYNAADHVTRKLAAAAA
jgi:hypothetical protein